MRKLLIALLVLVVLVAVGELFADNLAEDMIEQRLEEETGAEATADVSSFPLVTGTLVTERVRTVEVTLTDLTIDEVHFDEIEVDVHGIHLPRRRLFDVDLRPTAIDDGTVAAFVSVASLTESLGVPLGEIDPATISAELASGTLTLEAPGIGARSVAFPEKVLPCSTAGQVAADGVRFRCAIDTIPQVVLEHVPR